MVQYWNIPIEYSGRNDIFIQEIYADHPNKFIQKIEATNRLVNKAKEKCEDVLFEWLDKYANNPSNLKTPYLDRINLMIENAVYWALCSDDSFKVASMPSAKLALLAPTKYVVKRFRSGQVMLYKRTYELPDYLEDSVLIEPRNLIMDEDLVHGQIRAFGKFRFQDPILLMAGNNMNHLRLHLVYKSNGLVDRIELRYEPFLNAEGLITRKDLLYHTK